jgi:hypothetical protein
MTPGTTQTSHDARERDKARRVRRRPAPEDYDLIRQVAAREAELAMAEYEAEEEARRTQEFRELLAQDAPGTRAFIEAVAAAGPTKGLRDRAAKILGSGGSPIPAVRAGPSRPLVNAV